MSGDGAAAGIAAWEQKGCELAFTCPIYQVTRRSLRSPRNGGEYDFYTFECPDWVNIVALTVDDELVMIRQFRVGTGKVELEVPGGGFNHGETDPVSAGARELFEETGYVGDNGRVVGAVCPNPALQGNICHTVMFTNARPGGETAMDESEDIETLLVPMTEVERKIRSGEITHGLVLNALHFLGMANQT